MKITFIGAAHEVTGSCTLIEAGDEKILVDYGSEQGKDLYENVPLPVAPAGLTAVCLTHAHIDHAGELPYLVASGYRGKIYATEATKRLCEIMLKDSAHIQESEIEWKNRKAQRAGEEEEKPRYTMDDVEQTLKQMVPLSYGQTVKITENVTATFRDAGHLLGSASIYLTVSENGETRTVLFSGDLGNVSRPLIRDPQPAQNADTVIIESTYGDSDHGARPDYVAQLADVLNRTLDRGGNLVIPAFAVGRTQELLYLLRTIKERKLVKHHPDFPVYVDSPLAIEATNIYADGLTGFYDDEALTLLKAGIDPIRFPGLHLSVTSDESKMINVDETPKVIISASGMCDAGRIRHHLKHNLWRKESTVLFVGYQSEGTVGRLLQNGADEVKIFGEKIAVHAEIATLAGISGHADRRILLNWLAGMTEKPKQVFVNHGDDGVTDEFADLVSRTFNVPAAAPYSGSSYDLLTLEPIKKGTDQKNRKNGESAQDQCGVPASAGRRSAPACGHRTAQKVRQPRTFPLYRSDRRPVRKVSEKVN